MTLEAVLRAGVLLCAFYLCLVYASYFALMIVGYRENRLRRREFVIDDLENRLCIAYVMNRMGEGTLGDTRGASIALAAYTSVLA